MSKRIVQYLDYPSNPSHVTGDVRKILPGGSLQAAAVGGSVSAGSTFRLARSRNQGASWETVYSAPVNSSAGLPAVLVKNETNGEERYRFQGSGTFVFTTIMTEFDPPTVGAGTCPDTGITTTEQFQAPYFNTKLVFNQGFIKVITDALAYGSVELYDFPTGLIFVHGIAVSLAIGVNISGIYVAGTDRAGTINDNADLDWSIGSAAADSVTLASTLADLVAKVDHTLDGVGSALTDPAKTAFLASSVQLDGRTTAKKAYLNLAFPTTTDIDADGALNLVGEVVITWSNFKEGG